MLVGAPATVTLTATNSGDVPDYNLSFRDQLPAGVTYVAGSAAPVEMGEPRIITTGTPARQTLLWENVSLVDRDALAAVRVAGVSGVTTG